MYLKIIDEDYRLLVPDERPFGASATNNYILKFGGKKLPNLPVRIYD